MKYWLLTTEYPPAHGGGISTYCLFTAQMMTAAGYEVSVFVNDDSQHDYTVSQEAAGLKIVRFNTHRDPAAKSLGYTARLSYAFAGIVKRQIEQDGKPAFIESQDYLGIAYYLTQLKHLNYSFLSGIPIIITIHSPAFVYLLYNQVAVNRFPDFWTGEMEKQALVAADGLISPTQYMIEEIKPHVLLEGPNVTVIGNPYRADASPASSFKRNRILYYGKLSPQKGSFELLAYFKELWNESFPHPLHIIGGTDIVFHPELKTMGQIVELRYKKYIEAELLQLHGKILPSQINEELRDAHMVIVPSIVDNMPYVVMEAMSLGKIVLASVQGGQREMIEDGVTGFLFDHERPGSFVASIKKILALTDQEVQAIGKAASEQVKRQYSYAAISDKKIHFLTQIRVQQLAVNRFPFLWQETTQPVKDSVATPGLLSVVVPFYNMGPYIEECIDSVLQSTYKNIEIIIVNDGSTEKTGLEKLQRLQKEKQITVANRQNNGLAESRNYGAAAASGEFLAFLDADDKVAPDYYEKAINVLQMKENVFFVGAWVKYFGNSNKVWPAFTPVPPYALLHNPVNSSSLVYKRPAFLAGGLNDKKTGYGLEDYESVVNMLKNGFNGVVLPEVLFHYRVRSDSMFRAITREKLLYSNKYIVDKHHAFYSKYAIKLLHLLNANGPGYLYENPTFEVKVEATTSYENPVISRLKNWVKKNEPVKRMALQLLKIKSKR